MHLTDAEIDTILTALYERRNRLASVEADGKVHTPSRPTLRTRIQEVNVTIRRLQGMRHGA